jgi:hypothetical protein
MTLDELTAIPRKNAEEVLIGVPGGQGYEQRVKVAVEVAMNIEWWRGYHAGQKAAIAAVS